MGDMIKTCFFREQEKYTQKQLGEKLCCDNEDRLINVIRRLKEFGVIKRVKKDTPDFQEINNEDYSVAPVVKDDTESLYSFCFVGVLWVNGFVIKCYPKYHHEKEVNIENFKEVLSVIKKYNHEKDNVIHLQNDGLDGSAFNMLALMLYFLNDYYANGLYTNAQEIIETNGTGEILWDKTINETFAYIKNSKPFYMELKTRKRINDETDFFSRLHQCILGVCSREFKNQELFDIFDDVSPVEFDENELDDFGDREYLCYRIERELAVQYNTRKKLLLKSMYAFIKNEKSIDTADHFSMFGTVAYHTIWESVCKDVLRDQTDIYLKYIAKPKWNGIEVEKTLIPDIITVTDNYFAIFDAKYYDVKIENNTISGQPGIESITKQYLYEQAFMRKGLTKNKIVYNAFIFPSEQYEDIVKRGKVEFSIMCPLLKDIDIIFVKPTWIYKEYLNGKKVLDLLLPQ